MYLHPGFVHGNLDRFAEAGQLQGLSGLLAIGDITELAENIFASGMKTARSLALTSTGMWTRLLDNVKVWNMMNASFNYQGKSGVFVVVTPDCTVGDILRARDKDPTGIYSWNVAKA